MRHCLMIFCYVPRDRSKDKQLAAARDLLRGKTTVDALKKQREAEKKAAAMKKAEAAKKKDDAKTPAAADKKTPVEKKKPDDKK